MSRGLLAQILLYARTARQLRWEQVVFRPLRRLQPRRVSTGPEAHLDLDVLQRFGKRIVEWGPGDLAAREARADEVCEGRFSFLGVTRQFPTLDWTSRHVSHLWTYNLHYFEYGRDLAWAARATGRPVYVARLITLIRDWIHATDPADGDGWDPYPVSTRIVNWCVAISLVYDHLSVADLDVVAASVQKQLQYLSERLEVHLQGNHLQRNLTALCTVRPLLRSSSVSAKVDLAGHRLWQELEDQVLPDGGHAERSPMYLALALGDFLHLSAAFRAVGQSIPPRAAERIAAMGRALAQLSRSDGTLHRFHDAADGVAGEPNWLCAVTELEFGQDAGRSQGAWSLPSAGYFGYRRGAQTFVIDTGPPGPPHLPAHAHCSLLSFELDMDGSPLIVDSGVNGYGDDPLRPYFRSTRAHNTIVVNDEEQSEIWGVFRIARRAVPTSARMTGHADSYQFEGAYRPFHDPSLEHLRRVEGSRDRVTVSDRVSGSHSSRVKSYLHFHPAWQVVATSNGFLATNGHRRVSIETYGMDSLLLLAGQQEPAQGWYADRFGAAIPASTAEMRVKTPAHFGYSIQRVEAQE